MNRVLIFAGGVGSRMKTKDNTPKQFLEIDNKAIIIYTIEKFQRADLVDDIVIVCVGGWEGYLQNLIEKNDLPLDKVSKIITGGDTGFDSRIIGLKYMIQTSKDPKKDYVMIHDGVRPLISVDDIRKNLECAMINGNAITTAPATETVVLKSQSKFLNRDDCVYARAPQTFLLKTIYDSYKKAYENGRTDLIDSASIADYCGLKLFTVDGPSENIKITTQNDFYAASGLLKNNDEWRIGK